MPPSFSVSIPASAPAKAPGTRRSASWLAASGPSMLTLTRRMPEAIIFFTVSGLTSVPFVAITIRRPRRLP